MRQNGREEELAKLKEILRDMAGQFDSLEMLLHNDEALLVLADRIKAL